MKNVLILLPFASTGVVFHVIYLICFSNPVFVEYFYSRGIYPLLSRPLQTVANLPFSAAEILIYAFFAFLLSYIVFIAASFFRPKGARIKTALFRFVLLAVLCSTMYASFIFSWSLNYARQPLSQTLGLDASPSSVHELYDLCEKLAIRANHLRSMAGQDENGVFQMDKSKEEINIQVKSIYRSNAPPFMNLGLDANVKGVATNGLLSNLNILGIYIPFTCEPNINMQMPDLYFASSALHEYAHYKGFAREDEANFIAYYISKDLEDTDFSYSSTMLALIHSLNQLENYDPFLHHEICSLLSDAIIRDLSNENIYWAQFKDSRETVETINNNYLLCNNQKDGVQSYGRMVDLLIALSRSDDL